MLRSTILAILGLSFIWIADTQAQGLRRGTISSKIVYGSGYYRDVFTKGQIETTIAMEEFGEGRIAGQITFGSKKGVKLRKGWRCYQVARPFYALANGFGSYDFYYGTPIEDPPIAGNLTVINAGRSYQLVFESRIQLMGNGKHRACVWEVLPNIPFYF